jgi:predicted transcriptional regulator of viral defense system
METLSKIDIYRILRKRGLKFLDYPMLKKLTGLKNKNSLYKFASRMEEANLIKSLGGGGKFIVAGSQPESFEIANFIYRPSYISLESALSHYGILSQFVYTVTSITTRKTKKLIVEKKEYTYSQIKNELFWGYNKKAGFLIALPEKALLDSLYFFSKGIINLNLEELDATDLDKQRLEDFQKKFSNEAVNNLVEKLEL